jgi:hypothetical protein
MARPGRKTIFWLNFLLCFCSILAISRAWRSHKDKRGYAKEIGLFDSMISLESHFPASLKEMA